MASVIAKVVLVVVGLPMLADGAVRWSDYEDERSFATYEQARPEIGHWLPEDLPASASNIDLTSNLDVNISWFEYDAPIDAVPRTCKPTGRLQFECDRYTLEWSGHWLGRYAL
ncbi:hypothetical protein [Noviluteimonas gilva]|uniref:YbbD head domain-containing protein n=1 Tax=Noviluteimonas gilva TaxID=2682097 RepID=A0A7C9LFP9_9GAMM|nr:hypothetical protein [Lysobacter gilvus]MUV12620.1 hypothetical protein [Lysobacter gilvus]